MALHITRRLTPRAGQVHTRALPGWMALLGVALILAGVSAGILLVGPYAPERASGWLRSWQNTSALTAWLGVGVWMLASVWNRWRAHVSRVVGVLGASGLIVGVLAVVNIGLAVGVRLLVEVIGENGSKIAGGVGALAAAGVGLYLLWLVLFDEE